jgi:hypothetical protein
MWENTWGKRSLLLKCGDDVDSSGGIVASTEGCESKDFESKKCFLAEFFLVATATIAATAET